MNAKDQIQDEVEKTFSLLENTPKQKAPADFLHNLNSRMEHVVQVDSRFYRSTLLKVAAVVAFIAMNTFTWFNTSEADQESTDNYTEAVFESYSTDWSNSLSYE